MLLDQAAERGEPLATLYASQAAIYGRFGFGHAAMHLSFDVALDRVSWAPGTEARGRVQILARDDALPLMRKVYDAAIVGRPGAVELDDRWLRVGFWESSKDDERQFYAVHEDDDGVADAFAMYNVKHEWPRGLPHLEMKVRRIVTTTPESNASLWRFLFDVDLVSRVRVEARPIDDPLLLQLTEPRAIRPEVDDGLFLRPMDVAAALEARAYAADGRVVLGITDETVPSNNGRLRARRRGRHGCVPLDHSRAGHRRVDPRGGFGLPRRLHVGRARGGRARAGAHAGRPRAGRRDVPLRPRALAGAVLLTVTPAVAARRS